MEPSHMKAEGVEDWLKHWLKMQQRKRRPLTLKYITEDHLPNRKPTTQRPKAGGNEKAKAKSAPQSSKDKNDSDSAASSDAESSAESSEEGGEESDGESGEERDEEDATKIKGKGKKAANKGSSNGKEHTNDCSDEEEDDGANKSNLVNTSANPTGVAQDDPTLPPSPSSAAQSKETRHAFLKSLSDDKNYRQLVRLLYAAKVSDFRPYYLPPSVR